MGKIETFIENANQRHNFAYDYSRALYQTAKTKILIICKDHGGFMQTPNNHLSGNGCPKCSGRFANPDERLADWIKKAVVIHKNKYDYSLVTQVNTRDKVKIICSKHGIFEMLQNNHITSPNQNGCKKCMYEKLSLERRLPVAEFLRKSNEVHQSRYDYSKVDYHHAHKKVEVVCRRHGSFFVTPANHWANAVGCQSCMRSNPSKPERRIAEWLEKNQIYYESQKTYKELYHKNVKAKLKFDFFIPKFNLLIEYDGEHHFTPIVFRKNTEKSEYFKTIQIRDKLKTEFCIKNKISLERIRYDEDIVTKLSSIFNRLC